MKNKRVSSTVVVQGLYDAAVSAITNGDLGCLRDAVQCIEEAAEVSAGLEAVREKAGELFRDDDIDIDDLNFTHHNGVSGYWVGAWLFVHDEEVGNGQISQ